MQIEWNALESFWLSHNTNHSSTVQKRLTTIEFKEAMAQKSSVDDQVLRSCLLFEFRLGHTAATAHRQLCLAFGDGVVSQRTCTNWFGRFKEGNFELEDKPRSGRPTEIDEMALRELVEANSRLTTREMADALGHSHSTIERHLAEMGKVSKLGSWVPHTLTQSNRDQRSDTCALLLSRHRRFDWLDQVLTGDEKWVMYANFTRKRQWVDAHAKPEPEPKPDLHPQKIMLSVWWDSQGIVFFELLPSNTTINATYYCGQLERLSHQLAIVRPLREKVFFLHDNARPHTAKLTRLKLVSLGWEILPHPPYSPDLAPSDYHLFRALQGHLNGKRFDEEEDLKAELETFFNSQPLSFFERGIHSLPERWRAVIESDGAYFED